jgi:bacillithiol biosynthesis deacetylase BshB1
MCFNLSHILDRLLTFRLNLDKQNMTTTNQEFDVLAVFSHPDDAELSVAGTLLKLNSLGYRTAVCDVTRGEMSTRGTPEIRAKEALDAAAILKIDARLNLDLPDGHLWLTEESRTAMVRVIRRHKPKVILTTHWDDPHPDHASTCRIVREAARLATMRRYDEEAALQPVPMPAIMHSIFTRNVVPSFVVDVSDFMTEKMNAIRAYASQFFNEKSSEPETRISERGFLQQIEVRMGYFGSLIGVSAGEAFYVREALNVDDPVALLTRPMNIYS